MEVSMLLPALATFAALAVGIIYFAARKKPAAAPPHVRAEPAPDMPVQKPGEMLDFDSEMASCDAVKGLATTWWPKGEAPQLPLTACSMPKGCPCKYRDVADRRVANRRALPQLDVAIDPRHRPDRRKAGRNEPTIH